MRAAAKKHENVTTIVGPNDYDLVTKELKKSKTISKSIKKQLAIKVFSHTANYDLEISNYFNGDQFEEDLLLSYEKTENLRYGENPHPYGFVLIVTNITVSNQNKDLIFYLEQITMKFLRLLFLKMIH